MKWTMIKAKFPILCNCLLPTVFHRAFPRRFILIKAIPSFRFSAYLKIITTRANYGFHPRSLLPQQRDIFLRCLFRITDLTFYRVVLSLGVPGFKGIPDALLCVALLGGGAVRGATIFPMCLDLNLPGEFFICDFTKPIIVWIDFQKVARLALERMRGGFSIWAFTERILWICRGFPIPFL